MSRSSPSSADGRFPPTSLGAAAYRQAVASGDLVAARVRVKETDILVSAMVDLGQRADTLVRRYDFRLDARYVLSESGSGTVLDQGDLRAVTSYNIIESAVYATLVAEQRAGRHAASEIGRKILERLTLYFDRGRSQ